MTKYNYPEAYCLLHYVAENGTEEVIWNARDGQIPLGIVLKSGVIGIYDWRSSTRVVEDYTPPTGSRIFVDQPKAAYRELIEKQVDNWLSDPESRDFILKLYGTRENALEAQSAYAKHPELVEVTYGYEAKRHARYELSRIGEDLDVIEWYCRVIEEYHSFGHSGGSLAVTLPVLTTLLQHHALTSITSDPTEWVDRSEQSGYPLWQNRRDSTYFSKDDGASWFKLEEKNSPSQCELALRGLPSGQISVYCRNPDCKDRWELNVDSAIEDFQRIRKEHLEG